MLTKISKEKKTPKVVDVTNRVEKIMHLIPWEGFTLIILLP